MDKFVSFCGALVLLSIATSIVGFTYYLVGPDTSQANAPPCVVTGDGRGQKKEWK